MAGDQQRRVAGRCLRICRRSASSSIAASTSCRCRFTPSSVGECERLDTVLAQQQAHSEIGLAIRPAALMRGPSAKPQVKAVSLSRVCVTSSSAATPGRDRRDITFRP